MALVVDADVIIAGEKERFELEKWLRLRSEEQFEVAAITVAELWHGVERATETHKSRREQFLKRVLGRVSVVPYTEEIAYEHARLWAQLEKHGKWIGYYDLIVAATALSRGCALATFNVRHFEQIQGLTVVKPK
jgi:tRNA(fMet)-specific endonuclease VapC